MAKFLRFLEPGDGGFIPMVEMDADNQRVVYEALGGYLYELWEQDALPNEAVGLVGLDDGRSVAIPFVTAPLEDITEI